MHTNSGGRVLVCAATELVHYYNLHSNSFVVFADDPPINVVRKFVHLLDQSDTDYAEEIGKC